ncbi:hypothetical protein [Streptomyces californicus]
MNTIFDSLNGMIETATSEAEASRDRDLPVEDRRYAAQVADATWRAILKVTTSLQETCQKEAKVLEPSIVALAKDDFSPEAMTLINQGRAWDAIAEDMDALGQRAVLASRSERHLDSELHDVDL